VIVIAFALLSFDATCGHPRHTATDSLNAFIHAVQGIQQGEQSLYDAGKISQTTHDTFRAKVIEVAQTADAAQTVLDAWVPGTPVPKQLAALVVSAEELVNEVVKLLPLDATMGAKVLDVYKALASILKLVAQGGA